MTYFHFLRHIRVANSISIDSHVDMDIGQVFLISLPVGSHCAVQFTQHRSDNDFVMTDWGRFFIASDRSD